MRLRLGGYATRFAGLEPKPQLLLSSRALCGWTDLKTAWPVLSVSRLRDSYCAHGYLCSRLYSQDVGGPADTPDVVVGEPPSGAKVLHNIPIRSLALLSGVAAENGRAPDGGLSETSAGEEGLLDTTSTTESISDAEGEIGHAVSSRSPHSISRSRRKATSRRRIEYRVASGLDRQTVEAWELALDKYDGLLEAKMQAWVATRKSKAAATKAKEATAGVTAAGEGGDSQAAEKAAQGASKRARRSATALSLAKAEFDEAYANLMAKYDVTVDYKHTQYERRVYLAQAHSPCTVCLLPHHLDLCPLVFPESSPVKALYGQIYNFENRMKYDDDFREAITYIRETFQPFPGQHRKRFATRDTRNCPTSAIPYLMRFDSVVQMRSTKHLRPSKPKAVISPGATHLEGYYSTVDDDGWPLVILFLERAPASFHDDPVIMHEINLIRTFVTRFRKGQRSRYACTLSMDDARPISIVMVVGRWHTSKSFKYGQRAMRLAFGSHYTWANGYYYQSVHIGTGDDELPSAVDTTWWSQGSVVQRRFVHVQGPFPFGKTTVYRRRSILRATLRDLREPANVIRSNDLSDCVPDAVRKLREYRTLLHMRCIKKYGADSGQARLTSATKHNGDLERDEKELAEEGMTEASGLSKMEKEKAAEWMPTWEDIMSLPRSDGWEMHGRG